MVSIGVSVQADVTLDVVDEIAADFGKYAGAYDLEVLPRSANASIERRSFNGDGVRASVISYNLDEVRVDRRQIVPYRPGVFAELLPAEVTAWQVSLEAWGSDKNFSIHKVLRIERYNDGTVRLDLDANPEETALAILAEAREVLARYPRVVPEVHPAGFKVFVAYGGGRAWEAVRDYLRRADIDVDAFTQYERAGQVTLDVVSEMIHSASMAVIVMTAADTMADGSRRARQNVVHEAGFAQGALGTRNVIVLLEDGVDPPSNIAGVTYIGFRQGEIHTTEKRVVALLQSRMEAGGAT